MLTKYYGYLNLQVHMLTQKEGDSYQHIYML